MFSIMHNIKNLCENLGSISHWSYKKIVKEKTALLQLMCVLLLTWLASEAWSPVHTSCECECEANLDVTNSQRTIRSSCPEFNSLANIAAKLGCDVKFALHSHSQEVWTGLEAFLRLLRDTILTIVCSQENLC